MTSSNVNAARVGDGCACSQPTTTVAATKATRMRMSFSDCERPDPILWYRGYPVAMRRMLILSLTVGACATVAAVPFLSPADVEKATGRKGIHVVPATARGAVPGRDNFADASGNIVLWFQTMTRPDFARARRQPAR